MATDSSDQLNLNPTTATEENPKQTLDEDTTTNAVMPTRSPRSGRTNWWEASDQPSVTVVDSDVKYGEDSKSLYGAKRDTIYTEIEMERGDEAWGTKKEIEKEAKSDHRNHKHIERKIYGPSTLVNFF